MTKTKKLKPCIKCKKKPRYGKTTSYCRMCANEDLRRRYADDNSGIAASQRAYYEEHREDFARRAKEWYDRNPDYTVSYWKKNKDRLRVQHKAWLALHPNYGSESYHRRKAKLAAQKEGQ